MYLLIQSTDENGLGRLRTNISHLLDRQGWDGDLARADARLLLEVEEDAAVDTALAVSNVPGVAQVAITVESDPTPEQIAETAATLVDDLELDAVAVDGTDPVTTQLAANGVPVDDDADTTLHVTLLDDAAYVYTETLNGIGGTPIDPEQGVIVVMDDRTSTVAAYRLMRDGYRVYPLHVGYEAEKLEDEMTLLRQFDPDIKLTVLKGVAEHDAIDTCCTMYGVDRVAYGTTAADDAPEQDGAHEVLLPNKETPLDTVLDTYTELLRPRF